MTQNNASLELTEIYNSLQGEGLYSGLPCTIIRLARCDIRCVWCDTKEAFESGTEWSLDEILGKIPDHIHIVLITGGEPLLQKSSLLGFLEILHRQRPDVQIILETGGHQSLEGLPDYLHICMDIKLPGSRQSRHNFLENLVFLKRSDEIKFVAADLADLDAMLELIDENHLADLCHLSVSPVQGSLSLDSLAAWILDRHAPVRMQIQLHKIIWGEGAKGV